MLERERGARPNGSMTINMWTHANRCHLKVRLLRIRWRTRFFVPFTFSGSTRVIFMNMKMASSVRIRTFFQDQNMQGGILTQPQALSSERGI